MQRIKISSTLEMSRLVYGMWRLGDDEDTSPHHVRSKIASCLDQGITSFDQADIYGGYEAEEILGNALKSSNLRQKIEIVIPSAISSLQWVDMKVRGLSIMIRQEIIF